MMFKIINFFRKLKDKLTNFISEHPLIAIGIVMAVVIGGIVLIIVLGNKDNKEEENGIDADYVSEVKSPEVQTPEVLDNTGDGYYYNVSVGYKLKIPAGFEVLESGNNIYFRDKNGTQFVFTTTTEDYNDVMYVCDNMSNYAYRMNILVNGTEKKVSNYGSEAKETKSVGRFDRVKYEVGEIWCYKSYSEAGADTTNAGTTKMNECAYFTLWQKNQEEAASKGIILMGTSPNLSTDERFKIMDEILSSFEEYTPTDSELNPSLALTTIKADGNITGNEIAYPSDWEVRKNSDGMLYIKPKDSSKNIYSGMVIEYYEDVNKTYVEDFAQFSGQYENQLMAGTFVQPIDAVNDIEVERQVNSMDRQAKIGAKNCYKYDISTDIFPLSRGVKNSMGSNKAKQESIRYCFESHGVPCVLNFITNRNDNCDELINKIIEKSVFY